MRLFRKVNTFQNNERSLIKKKKIDLYSLLREDFNIKKFASPLCIKYSY